METTPFAKLIFEKQGSYRTYEEWKLAYTATGFPLSFVLTVPMRNGNAQTEIACAPVAPRSYRTYEEWKQQNPQIEITSNTKFLPYLWGMETYDVDYNDKVKSSGSYRTYEEWKLSLLQSNISIETVLTVPMRNGNPFPLHLPCRSSSFLPYLWGMETR